MMTLRYYWNHDGHGKETQYNTSKLRLSMWILFLACYYFNFVIVCPAESLHKIFIECKA